eukprot:m.58858 g.58858  ORF g.58858 m.58858 type:complete len:248 (+) comp34838_c0_seq2:111-854(+)
MSFHEDFVAAAAFMRKAPVKLTNDDKLALYGLFKQAENGQCSVSKPPFYDMVGRAKWNAWKKLEKMDRDEAMSQYIDMVDRLCPEWMQHSSSSESEEISTNSHSSGSGPVTSKMADTEEALGDEEKTPFDWCKEGNADKLSEILEMDPSVLQSVDEEGMGLLHWACDRGSNYVVKLLIDHKIDVNIQDSDGQTPLHYACSCDFEKVVRLLLEAKAEVNLRDHDDQLPCDVATSGIVRDLVTAGLALY